MGKKIYIVCATKNTIKGKAIVDHLADNPIEYYKPIHRSFQMNQSNH